MSALTRFKELIWSIPLYREIHIYFDERKRRYYKEREKARHSGYL